VAEYWMVEAPAESIEVHRTPEAGAYRDVNLLAGSATVSLGAFPDVALPLAEVFV
jgi:hypothetical protein